MSAAGAERHGAKGVALPVPACDRGWVPQPVLRTARLLLVPLADRHLDLEIQLDSDPEVLRYLGGRARSAAEVAGSHARRMALTGRVDGLGFWMAFGSGGGTHGAAPPASEQEGEFAGLMMLPPARTSPMTLPSQTWVTAWSAGTSGKAWPARPPAPCSGTPSPPSGRTG